jgi:uncharacterized protein
MSGNSARLWSALLVGLALTVGPAAAARAGDESERITVTAAGKASIPPDLAEIRASVTAAAPLSADALKKFRDNRRRAIEALEKLKLHDLAIEGGGLILHASNATNQRMAMMFGNNNANPTAGQTSATENLVIRLSALDRMKPDEISGVVTKILDTAKDAGLTLGSGQSNAMQSELVRYRSTKIEEARAAAVQSAMQAARHRADALAAAAQAKVVRVISAREILAPSTSNNASNMPNWMLMAMMAEMGSSSGGEADEFSSSELKPLPVSVTIEAQFAIQGGN